MGTEGIYQVHRYLLLLTSQAYLNMVPSLGEGQQGVKGGRSRSGLASEQPSKDLLRKWRSCGKGC